MSEGAARAPLDSVWGVGEPVCGAKQEGRPDAPATYPDDHGLLAFKFGDEFVPAEDLRFVEGPEPAHHFDAAFSWVRHRGRRRGGGAGRVGGRDRRRGRRPRTAPPAARPPPAAATELSAGHRGFGGWAAPAARRPGGCSLSASGPAGCSPPCAGPALRPGRTARDHAAGGQAMRRLRGSPGSELPGPCALSQPSRISTSALPARPPPGPASPGPPGARAARLRPARSERGASWDL